MCFFVTRYISYGNKIFWFFFHVSDFSYITFSYFIVVSHVCLIYFKLSFTSQHENHQAKKKGLRLILVTDRCLSCAWVYFCSPLDPDIAPVSTKSAIPPIFFFKEWKKLVEFFFSFPTWNTSNWSGGKLLKGRWKTVAVRRRPKLETGKSIERRGVCPLKRDIIAQSIPIKNIKPH